MYTPINYKKALFFLQKWAKTHLRQSRCDLDDVFRLQIKKFKINFVDLCLSVRLHSNAFVRSELLSKILKRLSLYLSTPANSMTNNVQHLLCIVSKYIDIISSGRNPFQHESHFLSPKMG